MTNRIDERRIQPQVLLGAETPPAAAGACERALRATARARLDTFAASADTCPTSAGGRRPRTASSTPATPTADEASASHARPESGSAGPADAGPADAGPSDAGRPDAGLDDEADCPNDDYDRCIDRTVPNPELWVDQSSDAGPIDRSDIRQRQIGDCYVMAVLGGLTSTTEGRALLQNAIRENRDGSGQVSSYTVTLHRPERHWFASTTFAMVALDVRPVYARGHAEARPGDGRNEVWVPVMERAYALYAGGYNAMGHGGSIGDAIEIITGHPARTYGLWRIFSRYSVDDLQRDLLSGHLVVVASRDDVEQSRPDLVPNHAYLVTGLEVQGGKPAIRLWNPWGNVQPAPVPFDKLRSLFFQLNVGSAR